MRAEQNELLVRTGPGTPMGALFRRYWLPALLAEELPEPDCPPVRVSSSFCSALKSGFPGRGEVYSPHS